MLSSFKVSFLGLNIIFLDPPGLDRVHNTYLDYIISLVGPFVNILSSRTDVLE